MRCKLYACCRAPGACYRSAALAKSGAATKSPSVQSREYWPPSPKPLRILNAKSYRVHYSKKECHPIHHVVLYPFTPRFQHEGSSQAPARRSPTWQLRGSQDSIEEASVPSVTKQARSRRKTHSEMENWGPGQARIYTRIDIPSEPKSLVATSPKSPVPSILLSFVFFTSLLLGSATSYAVRHGGFGHLRGP